MKEAFFESAKMSPPLIPEHDFAEGINEQVSHFRKACTALLREADSEQNVASAVARMRFLVANENYNNRARDLGV